MKFKKVYICKNCGERYYKWQGQCSNCGGWNSVEEDVIEEETKKPSRKQIIDFVSNPQKLSDIESVKLERISTGIDEFDRVLSGGVVKGQVVLIGGLPGIGKSTLIMEVSEKLAKKNLEVLYVSGEESVHQLAQRAQRLNVKTDKITVVSNTDISEIIKIINEINPDVIIVDSIQTLYHPSFPSQASSPIQIKECTAELVKLAKTKAKIIFIVGQVTKEGEFAGPKLLEHMVDTVLYFENDNWGMYRILRTFKNRFGNVDEIGIFEMKENGLFSSSNYLNSVIEDTEIAGKAYSVIYEGTRSIILRVESLVNKTFYPYPKRIFSSIDSNYAQILVAAIEKNTPVKFDTYDIYLNIYSGFKPKDRSIDLAVCASIISSIKEKTISSKYAFIGEVSVLGQVYPSAFITKKISELERNGFKKIFISSKTNDKINSNLEIIKINDISELYKLIDKT